MKEMNISLNRLLLRVSATMLLVSYASGNECEFNIMVEKNKNYRKVIDQSLAVECPVNLCSIDLPLVTWCKINGNSCQPITAGPRVNLTWASKRENHAVHSLTFVSAELHDTGFYRCSATNEKNQIVGFTITVNISETDETLKDNFTTTVSTIQGPINRSLEHNYRREWLYLFVWPTLASLCLIIMVSSVLIYCLRGRKAKHRRQRPPTDKKVRFETSLENPQDDQDQPQVDDRTYYPLNIVTLERVTEATNDNGPMHNNVAPLSEHSEEQDSIIYVDLNHDVNRVKAKQQYVEDGLIEYATVCMRT
ncbi:B- and T-lymphocyte attenuator [Xenopus laevis]|uniref:B- and T-lymphocyte attenuator n=2 Tax=Xenopus laevis TaxID=8355 RepID=A0A1L8H5F9_XENLA|nr:B- and T-lymphocyte attenuator [Xenopus laevis]OCT91333.1 hypothetical protein XELAEV_18014384mg [Xenopus laevis]